MHRSKNDPAIVLRYLQQATITVKPTSLQPTRIGKTIRPHIEKLRVMVDPNRGVMADIPFEDRLFHMATGAIRMAQMAGARLIPCMITEDSTWNFTIHVGTPVPQEWLSRSLDMQLIGNHLLREFSKVISRFPEQCKMRCLRAMWPLPENGIVEKAQLWAQIGV